jgi:hypothetical protein
VREARAVRIAAAVVGGILVGSVAPARAQVAATAYIDNNVAGDVQSGRPGLGVAAGYYLGDRVGFELDAEVHGHFFRDEDLTGLVPEGVDLNTRAVLGAANVVVPYCVRGGARAGTWCPYATAGVGVIHAMFSVVAQPGSEGLGRTQTDVALNGGVGVMHPLTRWIGVRVDARYLHALVDESATSNGYGEDYGYWRVSVGVTVGWPR